MFLYSPGFWCAEDVSSLGDSILADKGYLDSTDGYGRFLPDKLMANDSNGEGLKTSLSDEYIYNTKPPHDNISISDQEKN